MFVFSADLNMAFTASWFSLKTKLFKGFLLYWLLYSTSGENVLQSFTGTLGPGNYSYFSLHEPGEITLIVESIIGDADIYVSEKVSKPTYMEYDIQSTTCGIDKVTVPKLFKRPVGIAIYGHPHSPETNYKITAVRDYAGIDASSPYPENDYMEYKSGMDSESKGVESEDQENEYSLKNIIWALIVGILKIVLEVLT